MDIRIRQLGKRFGDFAALDGGAVTLALATAIDHPIPGQVVVGAGSQMLYPGRQVAAAAGVIP